MLAGAVDDFSKAIDLEPRYADCWKRRGQARSALGENKAALQASRSDLRPDWRSAPVPTGKRIHVHTAACTPVAGRVLLQCATLRHLMSRARIKPFSIRMAWRLHDSYHLQLSNVSEPCSQDLKRAADLTADRVGKADCHMERGNILQKQRNYCLATPEFEVRRSVQAVLRLCTHLATPLSARSNCLSVRSPLSL